MKKKLTIFGLTLVAVIMSVMCVFTACNQIDSSTTVEPTAESLATMIETIELSHKSDFKDSTPGNYTLISKTTIRNDKKQDEVAYIKWTVEVTTEGANKDDVKVGEEANNYVEIIINTKTPIDLTYKLTATLTNKNGVEYKKEDGSLYTATFTHTVPAYKIVNWQGFRENCEWNNNKDNSDNQKSVTVKGYIIGIVSTTSGSKGSIYFQDEEGYGYYAYAPTGIPADSIKDDAALRAAWPVGTEIEVTGEGTIYSGQYEFKSGCAVKKTGNKVDVSTLTYRNVTEAWGNASDNKDTALIPYQNSLVTLEGCKLTRIDSKYYYFTVNGVEFNIYKTNYFMDDADVTAMLENYKVGKQATIKGLVSCYSYAYQIYPVGSDCITNVEDATFSAAEKVDAEAKILDGEVVKEYTADTTTALKQVGSTFNDVAISWSFKEGVAHTSATIDADKNLVITLGEETEEFVLVATISCGDKQVVKEYTVKTIVIKSNSFIVQALTAARALGAGETSTDSYMIIGTISEITTEYSTQFKNVSFNVTDGENTILVFRYGLDDAATLKVGDAVAFTSKVQNYVKDGTSTYEAVSKFEKLNLTSIAAAKKAGEDGTGVTGTIIYGQIKKIDTAYSEQYKNISVTLTDGTNDILCYRLSGGSDLQLGDYILVTGTPSAHSNVGQIAAGATYTKEAKVSLTDADKVTAEKAALSFTADTTTVPLNGKTYTDVAIAWTSSLTEVILINADGNVTINDVTEKTTVIITATLTLGDVTQTVEFTVVLGEEEDSYECLVEGATITSYEDLAALIPEAGNVTTTAYYTMGVVTEIANTTYGNMYISLNGATFFLYGVYGPDGTVRYDSLDKAQKPVVGNFIVVYGTLKNYNGTKQIVNARVLQINDTVIDFTATEKVAAEKAALNFVSTTTTVALKGKTFDNVVISWTSDNAAIAIADDGTVTVATVTTEITVKVTATIKLGTVTDTKEFNITLTPPVAGEVTATLDFVTNFATYAKSWANGYNAITLTSADLGVESLNATIKMSSVSKQTSTITDRPVIAAKNADQTVEVSITDKKIKSVTFNLKEWTDKKKFVTVLLQYSTDGGTTWSDSNVGIKDKTATAIGGNYETMALSNLENVTNVRLLYKGSSSSNNQIGLTSIVVVAE